MPSADHWPGPGAAPDVLGIVRVVWLPHELHHLHMSTASADQALGFSQQEEPHSTSLGYMISSSYIHPSGNRAVGMTDALVSICKLQVWCMSSSREEAEAVANEQVQGQAGRSE